QSINGDLMACLAVAKAPTGVPFRLNEGSQPMAKQKPEKVFRVGYVSASVFVNTATREGEQGEREFRTISLNRSYLDDEGERQSTSSLSLGDLPNAIRVLQLAQAHVEAKEAEVVG